MKSGKIGTCATKASMKGPSGSLTISPKSLASRCDTFATARSPWMEMISPCADGIEQLEGERHVRSVVGDLDRASSGALERLVEMLRRLPIGLRRADHPDVALEPLRENGRPQIVVSHVSGQQNRAVGGRELIEKLPALHFVGELGLRQFVIRGVGNRPGKVVKCEPGPAEIEQGAGSRPHDAQVAQDGASRRRGEEEKEDRPEEDHDRAEVERNVR